MTKAIWAIGRAAVAAAVLMGATLLAGCFQANINVPDYSGAIEGRRGSEPKRAPSADDERKRAINRAEDVAEDQNLDPDDYYVTAAKGDKSYWVNFDHRKAGDRPGWPYHFLVRVWSDGRAELFKDR